MDIMQRKTIPIGYEDIGRIVREGMYYVDKTLILRNFLDSHASVTLFTRPRRFGKTLNQSMFRRFFEDERDEKGQPVDNRDIFKDLAISQCGESYLKHQQQYPVIFLSLKAAKQPNFEMAYASLKDEMEQEFRRHRYVLDGEMEPADRERYERIALGKGEPIDYAKALDFLSACLSKYHGQKTVILIDEYDVPLENAYFNGFYDEMISFIRSLFESALKTNDALEFAVITGCLRISKESIFTGLNNLEVNSVMALYHSDAFGFTENEVKTLLSYYQLDEKLDEIKEWYDGYVFGKQEIYNPWSILSYVNNAILDFSYFPRAYWSNTSSNSIVRQLIRNADEQARADIELLMAGETIEKPVHEDITYGDIYRSQDNLWNFLYFTGYLKSVKESFRETQIYVNLKIPNLELATIYRSSIQEWFRDEIKDADLSPLRAAMEDGECEGIEEFISGKLLETISYYDYDESYYHGFLTGLLTGMGGYLVQSNRESGTGRADLILRTPRIRKGRAMILELKVASSFRAMEEECRKALQQMEDRKYEADLRTEGYETILKYGICFYKKECLVLTSLK